LILAKDTSALAVAGGAGRLPLHVAAEAKNDWDVVALNMQADLSASVVADGAWRLPLQIAAESGCTAEVMVMLLEAGGETSAGEIATLTACGKPMLQHLLETTQWCSDGAADSAEVAMLKRLADAKPRAWLRGDALRAADAFPTGISHRAADALHCVGAARLRHCGHPGHDHERCGELPEHNTDGPRVAIYDLIPWGAGRGKGQLERRNTASEGNAPRLDDGR